MCDTAIKILRGMQGYGDALVADVDAADFCKQPLPGMNHPAWILGHLAIAADGHSTYLGGEKQLDDWADKFGRGSTPTTDPADYPSKDELLEAWHAANERLIAAAQSATPEMLTQPNRGPLNDQLPTVGEFVVFSMTAHTAMHLGQLATWRRAMGRKPMF